MLDFLKTVWLRIVNPKSAKALEFRIRTLEEQTAELARKINRMKGTPEGASEKPEENKPKLAKSWAQRRAWLEATDGGRVKVAKN